MPRILNVHFVHGRLRLSYLLWACMLTSYDLCITDTLIMKPCCVRHACQTHMSCVFFRICFVCVCVCVCVVHINVARRAMTDDQCWRLLLLSWVTRTWLSLGDREEFLDTGLCSNLDARTQ